MAKSQRNFRELLESVAAKRKVPLYKLADETGLARASLYRWMDGSVPHFLQVPHIAEALGVSEKAVKDALALSREQRKAQRAAEKSKNAK